MVTVKAGNRGGAAGEESLSAEWTGRVTGLQHIGGPVRLQDRCCVPRQRLSVASEAENDGAQRSERRDLGDDVVTDATLERDTRCYVAVGNDRSAPSVNEVTQCPVVGRHPSRPKDSTALGGKGLCGFKLGDCPPALRYNNNWKTHEQRTVTMPKA